MPRQQKPRLKYYPSSKENERKSSRPEKTCCMNSLRKKALKLMKRTSRSFVPLHKLKTLEDLMYQIGKSFHLRRFRKNELKRKIHSHKLEKIHCICIWRRKQTQIFRIMHLPKKTCFEHRQEEKLSSLRLKKFKKHYIIADCCKPTPGDDVLGYIFDDNQ